MYLILKLINVSFLTDTIIVFIIMCRILSPELSVKIFCNFIDNLCVFIFNCF